MNLPESFIRKVIKEFLVEKKYVELLEGRRQREQLFKKAVGLETIYDWYKNNMDVGKIDNPRIDDT